MGESQSKESRENEVKVSFETEKEKLLMLIQQQSDEKSVFNIGKDKGKNEDDKKEEPNENGSENKKEMTKKINLLPLWVGLGVGGGALVSIIAAPFVIAGIGFGAGGVAAGSIAAAWMSASGPVAAGSLVAILQSIGAAGMGAASVGVAAAAGGAVGGGIATGVSLATLNSTSDDDESSKLEQNNKIRSDDLTSYKIKAEELKRLFENIPSDEWLIADYSGALVDDKLIVQGRLYLTPNYFCFYSKSNGKEIYKVLNLRNITDVNKESYSSNFLQFRIITELGKYVFVNLEANEDSYELLISIWKKSRNSELTSPVEHIKMITDIYGMDLGFRDTEEVMAYFVPAINNN